MGEEGKNSLFCGKFACRHFLICHWDFFFSRVSSEFVKLVWFKCFKYASPLFSCWDPALSNYIQNEQVFRHKSLQGCCTTRTKLAVCPNSFACKGSLVANFGKGSLVAGQLEKSQARKLARLYGKLLLLEE